MFYVAFFLKFIIAFFVMYIVFDTIYHYFCKVKKEGKPHSIKSDFKYKSLLYQIIFDFPRLMARYLYDRKSRFDEYGIVVFYGPQGCGKSMSVAHYAYFLKNKYPSSIVGSNFDLIYQDFEIKDFKTLLEKKNKDEKGENLPIIFCYDELNQWAFSRDWQSMPKNVISELAFQRKNKRAILGTAQSIGQLDKQVRIQCASGEFRRCYTFFDFITLVVRFKPDFDEEGNARKKKFRGAYIFLQNEQLRTFYDTNKTIDRLVNKDKLSSSSRNSKKNTKQSTEQAAKVDP